MLSQNTFKARSFIATTALFTLPFTSAQIPEEELVSIFEELSGSDYELRYQARMELQAHVFEAGRPGNEPQRLAVEAQLLARLQTEELLTSKLWTLRQLSSIGSQESVPALEKFLRSSDAKLAEGARMALARIAPSSQKVTGAMDDFDAEQLAELALQDENPATRIQAYSQLIDENASLAQNVLETVLEASAATAPEFLRLAMKSGSRSLTRATLKQLPELSIEYQIVVLGALDKRVSAKTEQQILELLNSENETLKLQALAALSRVGSVRSLASVLELSASRDRGLSSAAIDTLSLIRDPRIDRELKRRVKRGTLEERSTALKAMSYRASPGVGELVNEIAKNSRLESELREAAIETMERVGNIESLSVLVDLITSNESGLRRDAQKSLKRTTLRTNDAEAALAAFREGLKAAMSDRKAVLALLLVIDSAPHPETIESIRNSWNSSDDEMQKVILKVLPNWRNWDGGYLLFDIATSAGSDEALVDTCVKGIARLILGSDSSYPIETKYALAEAALKIGASDSARKAILNAFRNANGYDARYLRNNETHPEIKEAVEAFLAN